MANNYRLDQIYTMLSKKNSLKVEEMAELFRVTPTTIRRDLLVLEEKGLIYRSKGSAFIKDSLVTSDIFLEEKRRIAEKAATLIENGMTVALDSGTTIEALCDRLIGDSIVSDLDIVTHSLPVAERASQFYRVSMPGGVVLQRNKALVGTDVEDFYNRINVDISFLGTTGISGCGGLTVSYPLQLAVKHKMAMSAAKRVALLDSSKFLRRGVYEFCSFDDLDIVITVENEENMNALKEMEAHGVEVICV